MPGDFINVETGHFEWSSDPSKPYGVDTTYVDFELMRDNSLEVFVAGKDAWGDDSSATVKIPTNEVSDFLVGLQAWIENLQKGDKS